MSAAAGVRNIDNADQEYVERLLRLTRSIKRHGKYRILAFDQHYNADGTVDLKKTNMYVPNRYVVTLAGKIPTFLHRSFRSILPSRCVAGTGKLGKGRRQILKWLPNAMGMDPANPAIEPFYRKMKEHKMILLSHAGEEQAVEAEEDQKLGTRCCRANRWT